MNNRAFTFIAVLSAIGIFTLVYFLFSERNAAHAQTLTYTSNDLLIEENGGEYKIPESVCLTDSKRREIQEKIQENIAKLSSQGKLNDSS
ncbi:MAG TPA: hypothetical protein VK892_03325, partial [Pyrinomonadaceae bacterium]|nr:hypothetical protein [Pyrinomonadaceae bacterium]